MDGVSASTLEEFSYQLDCLVTASCPLPVIRTLLQLATVSLAGHPEHVCTLHTFIILANKLKTVPSSGRAKVVRPVLVLALALLDQAARHPDANTLACFSVNFLEAVMTVSTSEEEVSEEQGQGEYAALLTALAPYTGSSLAGLQLAYINRYFVNLVEQCGAASDVQRILTEAQKVLHKSGYLEQLASSMASGSSAHQWLALGVLECAVYCNASLQDMLLPLVPALMRMLRSSTATPEGVLPLPGTSLGAAGVVLFMEVPQGPGAADVLLAVHKLLISLSNGVQGMLRPEDVHWLMRRLAAFVQQPSIPFEVTVCSVSLLTNLLECSTSCGVHAYLLYDPTANEQQKPKARTQISRSTPIIDLTDGACPSLPPYLSLVVRSILQQAEAFMQDLLDTDTAEGVQPQAEVEHLPQLVLAAHLVLHSLTVVCATSSAVRPALHSAVQAALPRRCYWLFVRVIKAYLSLSSAANAGNCTGEALIPWLAALRVCTSVGQPLTVQEIHEGLEELHASQEIQTAGAVQVS